MRADGCHTPCNLFRTDLPQFLAKTVLNFIEVERGSVDDRVQFQAELFLRLKGVIGRLIGETKHLSSARELVMDARGESLDLLDGLDAPQDDLRAEPRQRLIPDVKLVAVPAAFIQRFEQ